MMIDYMMGVVSCEEAANVIGGGALRSAKTPQLKSGDE